MSKPIDVKCTNITCYLRWYCHTFNKKSDEAEQAYSLFQPINDIDCNEFEKEESDITIM